MNAPKCITTSLLLIGVLLAVAACRPRKLDSQGDVIGVGSFVGPWIASEVDVFIHSHQGNPKDDQLHFDSKALASSQGRKPSMTLFNGDGSYREETFNLNDSLQMVKTGFWHFYQDSLYMRLNVESSPRIAYLARVEGKGLLLKSLIDWDGDGSRDDEMVVTLRRP